uniref:CSON005273 protein n=1 Tax=Culicoides sonorensis TaxID=179676 RepID=A0A336JXV7_CULSO
MLYTSEYSIASNNSINDNKYNTEKLSKSTSNKIKKILKPLLRLLKSSNNKKQKKIHSFDEDSNQSECYSYTTDDCFSNWSKNEIEDNSANEALEAKLMNEINHCMEDAAIYVYGDNNRCDLEPVFANQTYVPVHFARTEAGTFFWTTIQRPADYDLVQPHCFSNHQEPQMQYGDRWVQA